MKEIPLTRGYVALVDDEDYERLAVYKWQAKGYRRTNMYACRFINAPRVNGKQGKGQTVIMHRVIINAPAGLFVDHMDGNGLNNCRSNIRLATPQQNVFNRKPNANKSHCFRGVTLHKRTGKWCAQIKMNGINRYLGSFDSIETAARHYNVAARAMFGDFARLNEVPHEGS